MEFIKLIEIVYNEKTLKGCHGNCKSKKYKLNKTNYKLLHQTFTVE